MAKVAAVQMVSTPVVQENMVTAARLVAEAADKGAELVLLPEYWPAIGSKDIEKLDFASFPGKIIVIDSVGAEFNRAIQYLRSQKVIGFDTETRPCFSQNQPRYDVSLLQLSGPDRAYLFRINKIGMHRRLCTLLAADKVIKVGAAIHDDKRGLQKHRDFVPAGFLVIPEPLTVPVLT